MIRAILLLRLRWGEIWYSSYLRLWYQHFKHRVRHAPLLRNLRRKKNRDLLAPIIAGGTALSPLVVLPRDVGFFSLFNQVLGSLQYCERAKCTAIVHFDRGPYLDPGRGDNWWNYYFEPLGSNTMSPQLDCTSLDNAAIHEVAQRAIEYDAFAKAMAFDGIGMSPMLAHRYITSQIRIKPAILAKVESFCSKRMQGRFVIGVQYRGTDKILEAPRVPYDFVFIELARQLRHHPAAILFVATDDHAFLQQLIETYGDRVVYWDSLRSSDSVPVHDATFAGDPYKKGEDVLIDCLLLSRCDLLLLTHSNVSVSALQFNPRLKFRDLTRRYTMLGG